MLDLNRIFGMREQMPQEGLLGFVLNNWLIIAIVIMVLGFVIDQVLYVVRYRPQDKLVRIYAESKKLVLRLTGKEAMEENAEERDTDPLPNPKQPVVIKEKSDNDAPVIRRGGAKYIPQTEPQPEAPVVVHAPAARPQPKPVQVPNSDVDADAPLVVRASARPAVRVDDREPDTRRGNM